MKCVTPLLRFWDKGYPDNYKIMSKKRVAAMLERQPNYIRQRLGINDTHQYECQEIPCGNCYACRLSYAADWATRLMLEKQYYPDEECWFITVTYDNEHLVIPMEFKYTKKDKLHVKDETITYRNDGTWNGTLVKAHIQNFIKTLRNHYPNKEIRYFLCGEYGSQFLRPHYHLIVFGVPFKAEKFIKVDVDKNYKLHYQSAELNQYWKYGTQNELCQVEWSNCSYVARYCMKKVGDTWSKEEWAKLGKEPEFVTMSRDIGIRYYQDHKEEIWKTDNIIMKTVKGNVGNTKPPKAFLRILEKEDPKKAQEIKDRRRDIAKKMTDTENYISDYTDLEKLLIKADKLQTQASMLKREL